MPATARTGCSSSSAAASSASSSRARSTATVFLDLRSKVKRPGTSKACSGLRSTRYASNGRLFVYYTRAGDGALVIAEYRRVERSEHRPIPPKASCS